MCVAWVVVLCLMEGCRAKAMRISDIDRGWVFTLRVFVVVPSDVASSFLVTKLNTDSPQCAASTNRMPLGCTTDATKCLSSDDLSTITTWITNGALD